MKHKTLKYIITFTCFLVFAAASAKADPVTGKVADAQTSGGYTYIEVDTGKEKIWIAAPQTFVQKGDKITFNDGMWMPNFTSKSLNRTFDKIMFVDGVSLGGGSKAKAEEPKKKKKKQVKVKYKKPHKLTIAEIYSDREALDGSKVKVEGKVVKVSRMIMGKNWIHVQDGTGGAVDGSNNLVFLTTGKTPAVGDKVTATGSLTVDKDFGAGYFYRAIVEDGNFE